MDSINFSGPLDQHLEKQGLIRITVDGDGNCLFRAIAKVVFRNADLHHFLRAGCCGYIEEHPNLISGVLTGGQSVSDYVFDMKRDATWGGEPEIAAIAAMYTVQFQIHDELAKRSFTIGGPQDQSNDVPLYNLAYMKGSHYDAVLPITDNNDAVEEFPGTGRPRTLEETSKLRLYIRRFLQLIWNTTIDKERIIIICTPKHLPGETVAEKLRNSKKIETTVLYTFNFTGGAFMEQLCEDKTLNEDWDVFYKIILPPIGVYNQREWIAKLGLYYILHTLIDEPINGIRFEFFFDVLQNALISNAVVRHWDVAKLAVEDMIPKLEANKLFCLDQCNDQCTNLFPGHFALTNMEPFPMHPEGNLRNFLSGWLFKDDYNGLRGHRLQSLLIPSPDEWKVENLQESIKTALDKTTISNKLDEKFAVYCLLLVTTKDSGPAPSEDNLWSHWNNQTADFAAYIGCTIQKTFRNQHARAGDSRSSVASAITPSSSLFIVHTEEFDDYSLAREKEAVLIGLSMLYRNLKGKNNRNEDYELLNQKTERMWFCPIKEETVDVCVKVMDSDWRLFRFPEEDFSTIPEYQDFGNFVILEQYPIHYFRQLEQVP